jgi:hypothetical protein
MSTDSDRPDPPVSPRPGVVKTLGVCNVVFSVLTGLCLFSSTTYLYVAMRNPARVTVAVNQAGPATQPGARPMVTFNPFMGMDDPRFLQFCLIDAGTGVILNGLMFATGIGLLNLKGWGARWWAYLAGIKIARLVLLWGFYIVAVAPSLSENMARSVVAMFQQQGVGRGRMIPVGELTRVYSIMNLIVAVGIIVFGSIYPAVSLWLLGRPGVKAALVDKPSTERELP